MTTLSYPDAKNIFPLLDIPVETIPPNLINALSPQLDAIEELVQNQAEEVAEIHTRVLATKDSDKTDALARFARAVCIGLEARNRLHKQQGADYECQIRNRSTAIAHFIEQLDTTVLRVGVQSGRLSHPIDDFNMGQVQQTLIDNFLATKNRTEPSLQWLFPLFVSELCSRRDVVQKRGNESLRVALGE